MSSITAVTISHINLWFELFSVTPISFPMIL